jgi:flagellar FliL protein
MSSAATEAVPAEAPKSKKKLIIILAVLLLVLGSSGAGALVYLQQQKAKALAEEEDEEVAPKAAAKEVKKDPKAAPPFFAMDPFTVNLADRDGSRYAQVSVSLELDDAKTVDLIKAYLPAIRSSVLMLLSAKTSADLIDPQGKLVLAREIQREVLKPLGVEMEDAEDEDTVSSKKKRKPRPAPVYPVRAVHFSNFIVQ